jgi:hypothetical protein
MKTVLNKIRLFFSFILSLEWAEHQDIFGECSDERGLLMTRYHVLLVPRLRIFIHKIHRSDVNIFHDHPRSFVSFILRGGYVEHTPQGSGYYRPGRILYRRASAPHWLEVERPALTLFIAWGKSKEWGFYLPDEGVRVLFQEYDYAQVRC